MDILKAKDIAKETAKLNNSFSQVMNLAVQLKEENDALKRQRDEALGKQPLFDKYQAEASELDAEDLKPALILALCQRDIALRSGKKITEEKDRLQIMVDSLKPDREQLKKIIYLLSCWEQGKAPIHFVIDHTDTGFIPSDFNIIRHIKDVILKGDA